MQRKLIIYNSYSALGWKFSELITSLLGCESPFDLSHRFVCAVCCYYPYLTNSWGSVFIIWYRYTLGHYYYAGGLHGKHS